MKPVAVVTIVLAAVALAADLPVAAPKDVADQLNAKTSRAAIFYVGPNVLYRSKHIPGSKYAGVGSKSEGLEALRKAVSELPRDTEVLVYCGCCPWDRCPNIKPALEALKQLGFSRVKAIYLPENFKTDWIDRGYPVEQ